MSDEIWFAPRRCGYGPGQPLAWQGWALSVGYALFVLVTGFVLLPVSYAGFLVLMAGGSAAFLVISARKTEGGIGWRCGKKGRAPSNGRNPQQRGKVNDVHEVPG